MRNGKLSGLWRKKMVTFRLFHDPLYWLPVLRNKRLEWKLYYIWMKDLLATPALPAPKVTKGMSKQQKRKLGYAKR